MADKEVTFISRSHQVSFKSFVASAKAEVEEFLSSFTVLNLALFNENLELGVGNIDDSEIVQTLKSELCKNIESVNLSGHPESIAQGNSHPMIILLSDYLPNLKYIYIRDIDLSSIDKISYLPIEDQIIAGNRLCQLYAKGIYIEGNDALMEIIKNKVINFLRSNGQSTYGGQLERLGFMPQTLLPEKFQKALDFFNKLNFDSDKKSHEAMIAIRSRTDQNSNEMKNDQSKMKQKK